MNRQHQIGLFLASGCLNKGASEAYIRGELSKEQLSTVEAHLSTCDFCREAIEGLLMTSKSVDVHNELEDINTLFAEKLREHKEDQAVPSVVSRGTRFARLSAAASIVIIALFSFYFYQLNSLPFNDVAEGYKTVMPDAYKAFPLPDPVVEMETWTGIESEPVQSEPIPPAPSLDEIAVVEEELDADIADEVMEDVIAVDLSPASKGAGEVADLSVNTTEAGNVDFADSTSSVVPAVAITESVVHREVVAARKVSGTTNLSINKSMSTQEVAVYTPTGTYTIDPGTEIIVFDNDYARPVYTIVDIMPSFPGGIEALRTYFASAISSVIGVPDSLYGETIFIEAIIDEGGKARTPRVKEGVWKKADREAVRAVRRMPRWNPGSQQGVNVLVKITIPVSIPNKAQ